MMRYGVQAFMFAFVSLIPIASKAEVPSTNYRCNVLDGKDNSSWGIVSVSISEPSPTPTDGLFRIAFKASDARIHSVADVPTTIEKIASNQFEIVSKKSADMYSERAGIRFGFSTETDRSKAYIVILADRPSEHFEIASLLPVASGVCMLEYATGTSEK
jgi:hypothetical protein